MTERDSIEPLTASMTHHPEYAKGWNAAIEALQQQGEKKGEHEANLPD